MNLILWYLENIWDYFKQMLPCMAAALAAILLLRPRRRRQLAARGLASSPLREGALVVFVMFCAGLASLTVFPAYFWTVSHWKQALAGQRPLFPPVDWNVQLATLQLTPFQEILRGLKGNWVMFLVVANVGIFAPLGFFVALLWRRPRWWKSMLAGFCTSCAIELIQFFIGRSTDVDDVILNTTGALTGYWLFWLLQAAFPRFCSKFQCHTKEGY